MSFEAIIFGAPPKDGDYHYVSENQASTQAFGNKTVRRVNCLSCLCTGVVIIALAVAALFAARIIIPGIAR